VEAIGLTIWILSVSPACGTLVLGCHTPAHEKAKKELSAIKERLTVEGAMASNIFSIALRS
jgi:hypothetical protein